MFNSVTHIIIGTSGQKHFCHHLWYDHHPKACFWCTKRCTRNTSNIARFNQRWVHFTADLKNVAVAATTNSGNILSWVEWHFICRSAPRSLGKVLVRGAFLGQENLIGLRQRKVDLIRIGPCMPKLLLETSSASKPSSSNLPELQSAGIYCTLKISDFSRKKCF